MIISVMIPPYFQRTPSPLCGQASAWPLLGPPDQPACVAPWGPLRFHLVFVGLFLRLRFRPCPPLIFLRSLPRSNCRASSLGMGVLCDNGPQDFVCCIHNAGPRAVDGSHTVAVKKLVVLRRNDAATYHHHVPGTTFLKLGDQGRDESFVACGLRRDAHDVNVRVDCLMRNQGGQGCQRSSGPQMGHEKGVGSLHSSDVTRQQTTARLGSLAGPLPRGC